MYSTKSSAATCIQKFSWIPSSFISKRALRIFRIPDFHHFHRRNQTEQRIGNHTGHSIFYGNHHHIYKGGNTKVARATLSILRTSFAYGEHILHTSAEHQLRMAASNHFHSLGFLLFFNTFDSGAGGQDPLVLSGQLRCFMSTFVSLLRFFSEG